jgi:hypothetical protein
MGSKLLVFNATFKYPLKTTDLLQTTDKRLTYWSRAPLDEKKLNSKRFLDYTPIAYVKMYPTNRWRRPWQPHR